MHCAAPTSISRLALGILLAWESLLVRALVKVSNLHPPQEISKTRKDVKWEWKLPQDLPRVFYKMVGLWQGSLQNSAPSCLTGQSCTKDELETSTRVLALEPPDNVLKIVTVDCLGDDCYTTAQTGSLGTLIRPSPSNYREKWSIMVPKNGP